MSKYVIDSTTLVAIGDAVREKEGTTAPIAVNQLATRISAIETGGGGTELPEAMFNITGDCSYRFARGGWNWYIDAFGNKAKTNNITNADSMFFEDASIKSIPFELNFSGKAVSVDNMFNGCTSLEAVPKINNLQIGERMSLFQGCSNLKEIPEDWCSNWDWSYMDNQTSGYNCTSSYMYYGCSSLRKVNMDLLKHGNPQATNTTSIYNRTVTYCYHLDEITDIPFPHYKSKWTSNAFNTTFQSCCRVKDVTFATQEDGTPYVMNWSKQTIDLSIYVGYAQHAVNITQYDTDGIFTDKGIYNEASYQALKDDVDAWTTMTQYSRYNHDSAVATINSLPDVTQGSNNVIKFKGVCGELTDGGAINTLTEEEIAVATAKGWTVTLV